MIQVGKSKFVDIEEYEGTYKLSIGWKDRDGKFRPDFCLMQNFDTKEFTDKRSLSLYMGKGNDGIANLLLLADEIYRKFKSSKLPDEIPF